MSMRKLILCMVIAGVALSGPQIAIAKPEVTKQEKSFMQLMKSFLPKSYNYKGWSSSGLSEFYIPGGNEYAEAGAGDSKEESLPALWEYINGAAEIYNQYSFEMLMLKRYKSDKTKDAEITLEVYKMKSPLYAFGIYSYERRGITEFLDIRQEGYYVKDALTFWRGSYYVKLSIFGYDDKDGKLLKKMAAEVSAAIQDTSPPPVEIKYFPNPEQTMKTAIYIPKEMLGLGWMGSGFTCEYEQDGKKYKMMLKIMKDEDEAEATLEKLNKFMKRMGKRLETPDFWDEDETLAYEESTLGNVIIFMKDNFIGGVIELDNTKDGLPIAEILYKNLK